MSKQDDELTALLNRIMGVNSGEFRNRATGEDRPKTPITMLELVCQLRDGDELAVGDVYSDSGFDGQGFMTFAMTEPNAPLGQVKINRGQAEQLRDFLNEKLARS